MAWSPTEDKRVQTIESKLNEIQVALNKLAKRSQLLGLTSIRQQEIVQLKQDMETLSATGVSPGLAGHIEEANPHPQYVLRDGSLTITGDLDLGGHNVVDVGLVDGRDVAADGVAQDNHIADTTIHFTEASINHANIQNVGTNTHLQIDTFIASKAAANGLASLDGAGKVPTAQLPALAITNTFVVASEATMTALAAETGDVAVRTDNNKSYILTTNDPTNAVNWQELLSPPNEVTSVFGRVGNVVATTNDYTWAQIDKTTSDIANITTRSHASLQNLSADDHTQYLLASGSRAMAGNLLMGTNQIDFVSGGLRLLGAATASLRIRDAAGTVGVRIRAHSVNAISFENDTGTSWSASLLAGAYILGNNGGSWNNTGLTITVGQTYRWVDGGNSASSTPDLSLHRVATNALGLGNGSTVGVTLKHSNTNTLFIRNAADSAEGSLQAAEHIVSNTGTGVSVYATADQTTNYERLRLFFSGGIFGIKTEKGGSGSDRVVDITGFGGTGFRLNGSGSINLLGESGGAITFAPSNLPVTLKLQGTMGNSGTTATQLGATGSLSATSAINQTVTEITATMAQSTGVAAGYTALLMNITESSVGTGPKYLADWKTGGTSRFRCDNVGNVTIAQAMSAVAYQGPSGLVFVQQPIVFSTSEQNPIFKADYTFDQFGLFTGAPVGNHFILGPSTHYTKDFDHVTQSHPTMFLHSNNDPDVDNTEWGSLVHDSSSFALDTGKGTLSLRTLGTERIRVGTTNSLPAIFANDSLRLHIAGTSKLVLLNNANPGIKVHNGLQFFSDNNSLAGLTHLDGTVDGRLSIKNNAGQGGEVELFGGLIWKGYTSTAADPTTTELPTDKMVAMHKNTSSGTVFLAFNDGGIIKKVALA